MLLLLLLQVALVVIGRERERGRAFSDCRCYCLKSNSRLHLSAAIRDREAEDSKPFGRSTTSSNACWSLLKKSGSLLKAGSCFSTEATTTADQFLGSIKLEEAPSLFSLLKNLRGKSWRQQQQALLEASFHLLEFACRIKIQTNSLVIIIFLRKGVSSRKDAAASIVFKIIVFS